MDRIRATGVLGGDCSPRPSPSWLQTSYPGSARGAERGSPGSAAKRNPFPARHNTAKEKVTQLLRSRRSPGSARQAHREAAPFRFKTIYLSPPPLPSPLLPSPLPRSLARSRSLCLLCSSVKYSRPRKVQSSHETDRALLLISQGENLQACECSRQRRMHTLLGNAGDRRAQKVTSAGVAGQDPTFWTRPPEVLRKSSAREGSGS